MNTRDIHFRRITSLRGPNIWTYRPAVEVLVDIGAFEDLPSDKLPGFADRLVAWLPGLAAHRCGVDAEGGFLLRLREGTWMGHILEHVTLELQGLIGMRTGFGKARSTSERGVYKVVVRSRDEATTRACLATARELLLAAAADAAFDTAAKLQPLLDMADSQFLGPSTASIVDAATARQIPSLRLTDGNLVQLGYGANSRRIWTAETDATSAIAEGIASDKDLTKFLLQACGVPIPEGRIVTSAADAWEAAEDIGVPVVVKPSDGNHGRGVSTELMSRAEVEAAFPLAAAEGSEVMVERFVRGNEHRLLVVGNRLVAAASGETASVVGDGRSTITELIDTQLNTDPRRGSTEDFPLNLIRLDDDPAVMLEIRRQGYAPASVVAAGKEVLIQRNGNVAFDVTEKVHPSVAATAALAARIVGLDIAGIDLVAEDISRPLAEQRGAIVEVNAGPSLIMHLKPASGTAQPVGQAIVDSLFPAEQSGRIPIVGIAGSTGMNAVARRVAWLIQLSGKHVGLACGDGMYFDQRQIDKRNGVNWESGHRVLLNRAVEAAVFENDGRMILGEGLAYDKCLVGVVTNVGHADGLAEFDVYEPDQVYGVLRTQVDVVLPDGAAVLNAGDPLVAKMAELCDGEVILYATDESLDCVARHRAASGRALFVRADNVILATGQNETPLVKVPPPPNGEAAAGAHAETVLAAIGAAWALGLAPDLIRAGTETFAAGQAAPAKPKRKNI
ncbi:MAG: cyanophycin synthetase [Rhodocyclales bacterium]|nr:cyanophycin synthetase [Rhodocyclales bacterium]